MLSTVRFNGTHAHVGECKRTDGRFVPSSLLSPKKKVRGRALPLLASGEPRGYEGLPETQVAKLNSSLTGFAARLRRPRDSSTLVACARSPQMRRNRLAISSHPVILRNHRAISKQNFTANSRNSSMTPSRRRNRFALLQLELASADPAGLVSLVTSRHVGPAAGWALASFAPKPPRPRRRRDWLCSRRLWGSPP